MRITPNNNKSRSPLVHDKKYFCLDIFVIFKVKVKEKTISPSTLARKVQGQCQLIEKTEYK